MNDIFSDAIDHQDYLDDMNEADMYEIPAIVIDDVQVDDDVEDEDECLFCKRESLL